MGQLEDEISDLLDQTDRQSEAVRNARATGRTALTEEDVLNLLHDAVGDLRVAVLRLARELDELRDA